MQGKKQLSQAGCDAPEFDAAALFESVFGMNRTDLLLRAETPCSAAGEATFRALIQRRADGEPLQYLLGSWPFYGREFMVGPGVLIPREETELLVEEAVAFCGERKGHLIDLCAGSGAIAVTCACELPGMDVSAVELSPEAWGYLQKNNEALCGGRVQLHRGSILDPAMVDALPDADVILSNPPYIPQADLPGLQREVQHEPMLALDGGADGLDFYRAILTLWRKKLNAGGLLAVECGIGQCDILAQWFRGVGLMEVRIVPDFSGIGRVVCGIAP
ncbi:MAG: peptide chain release factor N(5)-glutamine methyltransferase [Clostridia bacterium]|nr:peptide chain release factor N(5)-glutamine methyltransferase [Clostridia bacterium]